MAGSDSNCCVPRGILDLFNVRSAPSLRCQTVMVSTKSAQNWARSKAALKLGNMICLFAVELSDLDAKLPI